MSEYISDFMNTKTFGYNLRLLDVLTKSFYQYKLINERADVHTFIRYYLIVHRDSVQEFDYFNFLTYNII